MNHKKSGQVDCFSKTFSHLSVLLKQAAQVKTFGLEWETFALCMSHADKRNLHCFREERCALICSLTDLK